MPRILIASVIAAMLLSASPWSSRAAESLGVAQIVGGLTQPVFVTNSGDPRLFVVERAGRVRILKKIDGDWRVRATFLDIRVKVRSNGAEQGLLGLAFAPDYRTSGRFYVNYTNRAGDTIVAEYRRAVAWRADPHSRRRVLTIANPLHGHNGGWMAFHNSSLYIATGDGGGGQEANHAQDLELRLGKILRIDPLDPDGAGPKHFAVPPDNPYVGVEGRDEVYAYGLRNPWGNSFDPLTGDLWIGDAGESAFEEVNHVSDAGGLNFGWPMLEGRHVYPSGDPCASSCETLPVIEYGHEGTERCVVTGGYVARRPDAPLFGQYVFGDFCTGELWAVPSDFDGPSLPEPVDTPLLLSSFGLGSDLTIYAADLAGSIYRVTGS